MTVLRGAAALLAAVALAGIAHDAAAQLDPAAAESAAAEMARLYAMALEDDEMRSHLPDRLQMQMGKRPFMYEHTYYCWWGCVRDIRQVYVGFWDHEAYLRSIGEDTGAICARAYYDLVSRVGWLRDGAYWQIYLAGCSQFHSNLVDRDFAPLVEGISRECEMKVLEGWFVVAGGEFRRHGGLKGVDPPFAFEWHPHLHPDGSPASTERQFATFARVCLEDDSEIKWRVNQYTFEHSRIAEHPYAVPPEYDTTDPLGDWAETPGAREAREAGSRLAYLYGVAQESDEVRSRLPSAIQDAISLDVPEEYSVYFAGRVNVPAPNKYADLEASWFPLVYFVQVSDLDPTFCDYRPDLQTLCG